MDYCVVYNTLTLGTIQQMQKNKLSPLVSPSVLADNPDFAVFGHLPTPYPFYQTIGI